MLTITICEDTPHDVTHLCELLLQYAKLHDYKLKFNIYNDGTSLLQSEMTEPTGNIFLLDAILPDLNGIDIARKLRSHGRKEPILYLTTSRNYAVEAINYLLKPISAEILFPALDTAFTRLLPKQELIFPIQTNIGEVKVFIKNIIYVEQKRHFLYFHMENGNTILSKCLRISFENALANLINQDGFLRPHQSYLINALHVAKLTQYEFLMDNGTNIPISRLRWTDIRTQYMDYLFQSKQER